MFDCLSPLPGSLKLKLSSHSSRGSLFGYCFHGDCQMFCSPPQQSSTKADYSMATKNNHRDKIPTQNCSFHHRKQQLCTHWLSRVHVMILVLQNVKNAKSSQTVHSCTISSGTQQPEAQMRGDKDQKCSFDLYDGVSCFCMAAARMDKLSRRTAPLITNSDLSLPADQSR